MPKDRTHLPKNETFEQAVAAEERELGRPLKQWELDCKYRWWSLARTLEKSREEREREEIKKWDWPPWPSTTYWPAVGTPAWQGQCAKRRRDWFAKKKEEEDDE